MGRLSRSLFMWLAFAAIALLPLIAPPIVERLVRDRQERGDRMVAVDVPIVRTTIEARTRSEGNAVPLQEAQAPTPVDGVVSSILAPSGTAIAAGEQIAAVTDVRTGKVHEIRAPLPGRVVETSVAVGGFVLAGSPVAVVQSIETAIETRLAPNVLYRLATAPREVTATVIDGPGPFDCPFISLRIASSPPPNPGEEVPFVLRCAVPANLGVIVGTRAIVEIVLDRADNVLAVPRTAIDGMAGPGGTVVVARRRGETVDRVKVLVGIRSESLVEVRSGLEEGDLVLDPVPPGG